MPGTGREGVRSGGAAARSLPRVPEDTNFDAGILPIFAHPRKTCLEGGQSGARGGPARFPRRAPAQSTFDSSDRVRGSQIWDSRGVDSDSARETEGRSTLSSIRVGAIFVFGFPRPHSVPRGNRRRHTFHAPPHGGVLNGWNFGPCGPVAVSGPWLMVLEVRAFRSADNPRPLFRSGRRTPPSGAARPGPRAKDRPGLGDGKGAARAMSVRGPRGRIASPRGADPSHRPRGMDSSLFARPRSEHGGWSASLSRVGGARPPG